MSEPIRITPIVEEQSPLGRKPREPLWPTDPGIEAIHRAASHFLKAAGRLQGTAPFVLDGAIPLAVDLFLGAEAAAGRWSSRREDVQTIFAEIHRLRLPRSTSS